MEKTSNDTLPSPPPLQEPMAITTTDVTKSPSPAPTPAAGEAMEGVSGAEDSQGSGPAQTGDGVSKDAPTPTTAGNVETTNALDGAGDNGSAASGGLSPSRDTEMLPNDATTDATGGPNGQATASSGNAPIPGSDLPPAPVGVTPTTAVSPPAAPPIPHPTGGVPPASGGGPPPTATDTHALLNDPAVKVPPSRAAAIAAAAAVYATTSLPSGEKKTVTKAAAATTVKKKRGRKSNRPTFVVTLGTSWVRKTT